MQFLCVKLESENNVKVIGKKERKKEAKQIKFFVILEFFWFFIMKIDEYDMKIKKNMKEE